MMSGEVKSLPEDEETEQSVSGYVQYFPPIGTPCIKEEDIEAGNEDDDEAGGDILEGNEHSPVQCLKCDRDFPRKCDLSRHVKSCRGKGPFMCDKCGKIFGNYQAHYMHAKKCDPVRKLCKEDHEHQGGGCQLSGIKTGPFPIQNTFSEV